MKAINQYTSVELVSGVQSAKSLQKHNHSTAN